MAGFSLLALSLVMAGAGTAVSVAGSVKAGRAAKKAGAAADAASIAAGLAEERALNDQAGLSDYNAQVADLQAADALARGRTEESTFRTGVRGLIGKQRAGIAGGNIDVGFGSATDVQADAAFLGELDALTIRTNAAREAWGFQVQGEDLRRRAAILRKEGKYAAETGIITGAAHLAAGNAASTASRWGAASTLLGGGSNLLAARYGAGGGGGRTNNTTTATTIPLSTPANWLPAGGTGMIR